MLSHHTLLKPRQSKKLRFYVAAAAQQHTRLALHMEQEIDDYRGIISGRQVKCDQTTDRANRREKTTAVVWLVNLSLKEKSDGSKTLWLTCDAFQGHENCLPCSSIPLYNTRSFFEEKMAKAGLTSEIQANYSWERERVKGARSFLMGQHSLKEKFHWFEALWFTCDAIHGHENCPYASFPSASSFLIGQRFQRVWLVRNHLIDVRRHS